MQHNASIKSIAAELGVSHSLVSKVLNNRMGTTGVSPAVREAIQSKAAELDYTPNRLAVALKRGRKDALGVFVHQLGSPGSDVGARLFAGISEVMDSLGLHMWLRFFKSGDEFVQACDLHLTRQVDGLIVAGVSHPEIFPRLRDIAKGGTPAVTVFADTTGTAGRGLTNVRADYELQGYLPTKHLLDQGVQTIVNLRANSLRNAGFDRACKDAGLSSDRIIKAPVEGFFLEHGSQTIRTLLKKKQSFDAVVCQSDAQAAGVINELFRHGISVPGSVRVTGVDNSPLAQHCIVPITTVTSEMGAAGSVAVKTIMQTVEGAKPPTEIILPPRLVINASTGSHR